MLRRRETIVKRAVSAARQRTKGAEAGRLGTSALKPRLRPLEPSLRPFDGHLEESPEGRLEGKDAAP